MSINNILFATSEVHPLIKTGGLADVSASLPIALKTLRRDVRIILPAYRKALENAEDVKPVAKLKLDGVSEPVGLLEGRLPGSSVLLWLVDAPRFFDRSGNPYTDSDGKDWPDNAERFTVFSRAVVAVASNQAGLSWLPDLVHCNDWQTGLVPALLQMERQVPATVFTIHNLAYQGLFPLATFEKLRLPKSLWSMHGMEFYNQFSFIKGGLVYADMINTVSPTYAREIRTKEFGAGLEDQLNSRSDRLTGILNGVDYTQWNPAKDPLLTECYNTYSLEQKSLNKATLQLHFGLSTDPAIPLIGLIGRLVEQKGIDLLLDALPELVTHEVQFAILGSGDKQLEARLRQAMDKHPDKVGVYIGYNESLAHQIEGGADMFLMPSRYEPCGLNQIYSLRYGTVPIVRKTGGLADTVVDTNDKSLANGTATGYVFEETTAEDLVSAVERALLAYQVPQVWKKLIFTGMQQDFSWRRSAKQYLSLYQQAQDYRNEAMLA